MNPERHLPRNELPDKTPAADLAMLHVAKHADHSKARKLAEMGPERAIEKVMRRGKIDLGGNCSLVKCPCSSKPAGCVLFPMKHPKTGEKRITCSGPIAVQKKKRKLLGGKKTVYDYRSPYHDCPYNVEEGLWARDVGTLILSQLSKYPDDWEQHTKTDIKLEDIDF